MSETIVLKAKDGHELEAYVATPAEQPVGSVVVVQEIFGVTPNIRRVVDRYAAEGFKAIAPAMFDRIEPGLVLDYGDVPTARAEMQKLEWPDTLADVAAAAAAAGDAGPVAIVGFCWGGTVAHVAAADLNFDAAVSYYGGRIVGFLDKQPRCPIMYHFGDRDTAIPAADIEAIRQAVPGGVVYVYAGAQHGFSCEDRASYDAAAARLAFDRSLVFLRAATAPR